MGSCCDHERTTLLGSAKDDPCDNKQHVVHGQPKTVGFSAVKFSANQNAKRLHGAQRQHDVQSTMTRWIPYMSSRISRSTKGVKKAAPQRKPSQMKKKIGGVSRKRAPVAKGTTVHTRSPIMTTISRGGMRVKHSEFFADVAMTNSAFALSANSPYAINPANESMFPWLSDIAQRFETYKFKMLRFRYEPMVPTTTSGAVYLAIDYDATDPAPTSKLNMLAYKGLARGPVWESISQHSDVSDLQKIKERNTLNQIPPAGQDPRLYNVGNLWIASESVNPAASAEMWVDYDVEFQTPQLNLQDGPTTISLVAGAINSNPLLGAIATSAAKVPLASLIPDTTGTVRMILNQTGQYLYNSTLGTTTAATTNEDVLSLISGAATVISAALPFGSAAGTAVGAVTKTSDVITVTQAPAAFGISTPGLGTGVMLNGSKILLDKLAPLSF